MKKRVLIFIMLLSFIGSLVGVSLSSAKIRLPSLGSPIFQLTALVFGGKGRRDTYRMADRLLKTQLEHAKEKNKELKEAFHANKLSQGEYQLRLIYVESQRKRFTRLHQLLKSEAHHEFNQLFKRELLVYAARRLAKSRTFSRQTGDVANFLGDSSQQLTSSINQLKRVERLFWPDEIRKAHSSLKAARKAFETTRLLGPTPRGLGKLLKRLDQKLDKLQKKTEPRTIKEMIKDLQTSHKTIKDWQEKMSGVVEKFKKLEAENIRVTRWISKDPEIQALLSEIPVIEGFINAAHIRRPMGDEMYETLKDLQVKPTDSDIKEIKKKYLQNLGAHYKETFRDGWEKGRIRPEEKDRMLINAIQTVTGLDVKFPKVVAVIQGEIDSGEVPLQVSLDGRASRGPIVRHTWYINDKVVNDGPVFSKKFEEKGTYTVVLKVWDRRGQLSTAERKIKVIPKYNIKVGVDVSVSPPKVKGGEEVTISALPTVKGVEEGQMTVVIKVDGITEKEVEEEIGSDKAVTLTYPIPEKASAGEWKVNVTATFALPEEIKKALKKDAVSGKGEASFFVEKEKEEGEDLEVFVGDWSGKMTLIDSMPKLPLKGRKPYGFAFSIDRSGNQLIITNLMQTVESVKVEESTLTIQGRNTYEFDKYEEVSPGISKPKTYRNVEKETMKLTLSSDGKTLTGTRHVKTISGPDKGGWMKVQVTAEKW